MAAELASTQSKEAVGTLLSVLDGFLLDKTYLVGESLSINDVTLACSLEWLFCSTQAPAGCVNVTRWYNTIVNQPQFKALKGFSFKSSAPAEKKEAAPKPQKAKAAPAPKKPAKEEVEEEEEEAPVVVDPTIMDMDAWKRAYSNTADTASLMPGFWEKVQSTKTSVYLMKYKYNDDLNGKAEFLILNGINGFYQRMDVPRKVTFGVISLLGKAPGPYSLEGAWVFAKPEFPTDLTKDVDDIGYYEWTKVDPTNAEQRKIVEEHFIGEGSFGGQHYNQCKVFK